MDNVIEINIDMEVILKDGTVVRNMPINLIDIIKEHEEESGESITLEKHWDEIEQAIDEIYKIPESIDRIDVINVDSTPTITTYIKGSDILRINITKKDVVKNMIKEFLTNREKEDNKMVK